MSQATENTQQDPRVHDIDPIFAGLIYEISTAFKLLAMSKGGRATHTGGIVAGGKLKIDPAAELPENATFKAGKQYPVLVRHANIKGFPDDAVRDGRGLTLRLLEGDADADLNTLDLNKVVLDVLSSTGSRFFLSNAMDFARWVGSDMAGRTAMLQEFPEITPIFADIVRNPDSYTEMFYYSETTYMFRSTSGERFHMRYHLRPLDGSPESGRVPLDQIKLPQDYIERPECDTRPADYLRADFRDRVTGSGVTYKLQVQLRPVSDSPALTEEARDSTIAWDEPFLDVGTIALNVMIDDQIAKPLAFSPNNCPEDLSIIYAKTAWETASINHLRSVTYDFSASVRNRTPLSPALAALNRNVTGLIFHVDKSPMVNSLVEIWEDFPGGGKLLGTTLSNQMGMFTYRYDASHPDWKAHPPLRVKIIRPNFDGGDGVLFEMPVPENYDCGVIVVPYWEYVQGGPVPQLLAAAGVPQGFVPTQERQLIVKGGGLSQIADQFGKEAPLSLVQGTFDHLTGPPLTVQMGKEKSRSDEFYVEAMLNGFAPAMFTVCSNNKYHVRYNFDDYDFDDTHTAPNVHAVLKKLDNGKLVPDSITYQVRKVSAETGRETLKFDDEVVSTPGDEHWETAKFYFRVAEFIFGQARGHLGRGHLNVGQYALAFYRNIQYNPIHKLLQPHLKGVTAINVRGDGIIFGDTGVIAQLSPLTGDALMTFMRDDLGAANWRGWKPRKQINDQHSYAAINNLYWEIVDTHVARFIETNKQLIVENWEEIYNFSQDLVGHAVDFDGAVAPDGEQFYDFGEISSPGDNGKAVSRITAVASNPSDRDMANLRQACAYVIYHATIWHDWRNDNQKNYGGELDFARLSINYNGEEAARQLNIVNLLVMVRHGFLTVNEEGDVPMEFVAMLQEKAEAFKDLGYDITDLRSRINI